ncbi:MAG: tail fiber domain-containing protein [Nostoc sp. ChiSLP02]|nr:tail fiber domain-containing protein [Nostoc sp. DedSLP01]MDZ8183670.1 tail fiber domain-containing protein [Nostoc sp. ChiSLP02]
MAQKSRTELQGLFKTGTKPSQQDFADFIESTLNIKDDGIEKLSGTDTPLKITAQGTDEKLLDFYAADTKTWSINQKPDKDKIGLNISNSGGSKLFITSTTGNVGIGTTTPGAKLEVNGDLKVTGAITGKIDTANITSGILTVDRIPNLSADKITSGILSVDRIPSLSTDKITSGVLAVDRIPNLSTNKITSGILTVDRIPNLSADKITSGILTVDRIPNLSADKITSGILAVDRIPNLSADKITSGILTVDRIPNLSADKITTGTISGSLSVTESLRFGASIRQMINLWNENYGIGIQNSTQYFRTDKNFAWYKGGAHNDTELSPGDKGTVQMVIKDSNVGIGTAAPSHKFHVLASDAVGLFESSGKEAYLRLSSKEGFDNRVEITNRPGGRLSLWTAGGGDVLNITKDGNVGIGTTSPGAKLEVNGDLKLKTNVNELTMYVDGDGLLFKVLNSFQGKANSNRVIKWDGDNNWDSVSDVRLKTNIENEGNILSRLMQLDVKNYHWKDNPDAQTKKIGFIAQDVQPLFPSIVGEIKNQESSETTLTLKYSEFGILAIGGLKEFKTEIDWQLAKIKTDMNDELNELKNQIQKLSNLSNIKI